MHEVMRALIARWVAFIATLGFARARYSYQSHTMRALRAVAYLTNALQVRSLVPGEEVCRRVSSGLILEVDVGERLPVGVADDEADVDFLNGPGRRESAGRHKRGRIML
jgi:hypothetical protein